MIKGYSLRLALLLAPSLCRAEAAAPGRWSPDEGIRYAAEVARTTHSYTVQSFLGPLVTPIPPELADFLLDHPDLSASIVRGHKIAPYRIEMRGPSQSWVDDGAGTRGIVTLVDKSAERRSYLADGTYQTKMFPLIHATAAILMEFQRVERPGCLPAVRTEFDVYVDLRNPLLSGIVKTLRPFLRKTVARKFSKAFMAAHEAAKLMARDPDGMTREILAFEGLSTADREAAKTMLAHAKDQPAACREVPDAAPEVKIRRRPIVLEK